MQNFSQQCQFSIKWLEKLTNLIKLTRVLQILMLNLTPAISYVAPPLLDPS